MSVDRKKLPKERCGHTFEIKIYRPNHRNGDLEMFVTVNVFPDTGLPGEIFIKSDRSGSMASGALDAVAMSLSIAWQYGVPFEQSISKFVHMRFEPEGMTGDQEFPIVSSPLDYIARLLLARFGRPDQIPKITPPGPNTPKIAESSIP
jgi:ribonucleoside-diphosphate reductase alpha chain